MKQHIGFVLCKWQWIRYTCLFSGSDCRTHPNCLWRQKIHLSLRIKYTRSGRQLVAMKMYECSHTGKGYLPTLTAWTVDSQHDQQLLFPFLLCVVWSFSLPIPQWLGWTWAFKMMRSRASWPFIRNHYKLSWPHIELARLWTVSAFRCSSGDTVI